MKDSITAHCTADSSAQMVDSLSIEIIQASKDILNQPTVALLKQGICRDERNVQLSIREPQTSGGLAACAGAGCIPFDTHLPTRYIT
jgi:hypothetical protein